MESFPSWQSRVGFSVRPAIVHTPLAEPLLKIAILGAGISGTTLARLLAADGHQVVVLEKTDRAGGLCKSQNVDGFTFDEAGGHIMFSKDKDVLGWMIDRVGGEEEVGPGVDLAGVEGVAWLHQQVGFDRIGINALRPFDDHILDGHR